jgi:hypothetical protein
MTKERADMRMQDLTATSHGTRMLSAKFLLTIAGILLGIPPAFAGGFQLAYANGLACGHPGLPPNSYHSAAWLLRNAPLQCSYQSMKEGTIADGKECIGCIKLDHQVGVMIENTISADKQPDLPVSLLTVIPLGTSSSSGNLIPTTVLLYVYNKNVTRTKYKDASLVSLLKHTQKLPEILYVLEQRTAY